jgi:uncharacterized protein
VAENRTEPAIAAVLGSTRVLSFSDPPHGEKKLTTKFGVFFSHHRTSHRYKTRTKMASASHLHAIVRAGDEVSLRQLLTTKKINVNFVCNMCMNTPLHEASHSNSVSCAALLLKHGAVVDARDVNGDTPLHLAMLRGYTDMMKLLLSYGADVNCRNNKEVTPLMMIANASIESIKLLLEYDADINFRNPDDGRTPLLVAALFNKVDVATLLLDAGADVTAGCNLNLANITPLWVAVKRSNYELAKLLLERGADPDSTIARGVTPFDTACKNVDLDMVALLQRFKIVATN